MPVAVDAVRWDRCYDAGWRDLIVPGAFAHPAKMARGLVARIFDELFAMGALQRGSVVVDPFGGIGTTAIEGASRGVQVICCELEPKFVDLQRENYELHRRDWQAMGRPMPVVVQGDSRQLRAVLGPVLAECVVSSPPYSTGDSASAQSIEDRTDKSATWIKERFTATGNAALVKGYGKSVGQLGVMPAGPVADALVSSPPFEGTGVGGSNNLANLNRQVVSKNRPTSVSQEQGRSLSYGDSDGQLGQQAGDTFWSAARDIVAESYAILKPGGVAVWVTKMFVRKGQIVDFPGDWRKLCEHVGFELIQEVHASLVCEETRSHLFDGERTTRRERKSFFRRLAEKKGSPRIDFETVLFMRKPPTPLFASGVSS